LQSAVKETSQNSSTIQNIIDVGTANKLYD